MKRTIGTLGLLIILLVAGLPTAAQGDDRVTLRIINTADEHGWLQPFTPFGSDEVQGGAANIYSWWTTAEDYDPAHTVILSGGDNWTGPSIATWFAGEPVVDAMNAMGYAATAIGNHEFDFGRDVLIQRIDESDYAYLGANIRYAEDGALADFAEPYILLDVDGVTIGVIGLTTVDTVTTTHPRNISDLVFADYADTLADYVPEMREAGADIVIALTHICVNNLADLAFEADGLVDAMFGGHCNAFTAARVNGIPVLGSGWAWRSYAQLDITYNRTTETIESADPALIEVGYAEADGNPVTPAPTITALVTDWQAQVDAVLAEEIGYTTSGVARQSPAMVNGVVDTWLDAYPSADVAITNIGGFRQDIPAGAITVSDIVAVMPFENRIFEVEITGEELAANLACCGGAVAGITYTRGGGSVDITFMDGRAFDPVATYRVLISDFMYYGGDSYLFEAQDPDAYDTGIQWRQPVIDWLRANPTTPDDPVDDYLDPTPRGR
jgi:5'-nucleotidase/UDP-sugar diphosphatase